MIMTEPIQLTTMIGLGFVLGLRHALDADHVVAVSTIVSRTKSLKKSSLSGAMWGLGHTSALFLAGLAILIFGLSIPARLALSFEFLVGIVLVLLGLDVLRKLVNERVHPHRHNHGDIIHAHFHSHKESLSHNHAHKPFVVGMVHGLAGSAALMLLVLAAAGSIFQGLLYILVFGAGSIAGMLIISGVIGLPFLLTAGSDNMHKGVTMLAGTVSIVLGFTIMYEIGLFF